MRPEALAHGFNDPAVGLVGDDALDSRDINFAALQRLGGAAEHGLDGVFKGFFAFHAQEMLAGRNGLGRGGTTAAAAGHVEQASALAVRAHHGGEQAVRVRPVLQHGRARTVAKEDARVAVLPIHDGRKLFRADDQNGVIGAGHDELLGDFQAVDESGAGGLQVEGGRAQGADLLLDQAGRRGKDHVGGDGGENNEVNLIAGDARGLHRAQRGLGGHVGSELVRGGEAPLLDAGARRDPFVSRGHHFFEVLIGEDFDGHVGADSGNGTGPALKVEFGAGVPEFGSSGRTHAERGAGAAASHSASRSLARAISRAMMSLT